MATESNKKTVWVRMSIKEFNPHVQEILSEEDVYVALKMMAILDKKLRKAYKATNTVSEQKNLEFAIETLDKARNRFAHLSGGHYISRPLFNN